MNRMAILASGVVSSVGLTARATCAAIRAKVTNPTATRFIGPGGELITGHAVALDDPWRGGRKLAQMAVLAADECLANAEDHGSAVPLVLCVPRRAADETAERCLSLLRDHGIGIQGEPAVVTAGKTSAAVAAIHARKLLDTTRATSVLVVAVDSLLSWPILQTLASSRRLLGPGNADGFIPGEAAAAILFGRSRTGLECASVGFGLESAIRGSGIPVRADGLVGAVRAALADADLGLHDIDLRLSDISGEQLHFKEAALTMTRLLRRRLEMLDIWHPAESIGECGVALGLILLAVADDAHRQGYSHARRWLLQMSDDDGGRAAVVLRAPLH